MLIKEEDLPRLEEIVKPLGYDLSSGWIVFDRGKPAEQKIYRIIKAEGAEHLTLDLLMVTPVQHINWQSRQYMDLGDRTIAVVSREALIRMKRATGRTQDKADIEKLRGADEDREKRGNG